VQRGCSAPDAVPVHRLDVGTSGVCLFARRAEFASAIALSLTEGQKEYVALAKGITRPKGSITRPIVEQRKPQDARTRYSRREVVAGHSLLLVRPDQGRRHQIRRHLSSVGHAVVGDDRYGDAKTAQYFAMRHFLDRPFLHLARVILNDGERALEITAKLAPDLGFVLASMRAVGTGDE
jgi:23S rRNA-/tRNA-specific pseudouridylate synthase